MLCCQLEAMGFLLGGGVHSWCNVCQPQYGSMAFRHCVLVLKRRQRCAEMRITSSSVAT